MMKKDLAIFIDLVDKMLEDEIQNPVVAPIPVEDLFDEIDIALRDDPMVDEDFFPVLEKLVLKTPKTASKLFFNQLFGGRNSRAVLGELLAVVMNNSMYTYKVGGPQIGVEKEIIRKISTMVGYDPDSAEGTLAPGGSMTNLMGLLMARDVADPAARSEGMTMKMSVYTSEESHYSLPKNVAFAGIGRNNIRRIPADDDGRMNVELLEEAIKKDIADGYKPCFVNATAGTTVLGAFDPLQEIGEICQKYGIWFHVDGAYCGSAIFSDRYKHNVAGSHLADSFTVNAHKMMATPLSCSIIVVKEKGRLYDTFANKASYLYQTSNDEYNPGKISMQCGRRNDTLKFWTLWKSIGTKGVEGLIDHQFDLAARARDYVADNPKYTLYNGGDSVAVCFNYKDIDPKVLCNRLYEEGELMVGYGTFRDQEFVRLVTVNSGNTHEDLARFFSKLETFADQNFG